MRCCTSQDTIIQTMADDGESPRPHLDLELSDEDEISYELKLFSKDNNAANKNNDHTDQVEEDNETVLDWSVSAISCATGLNAPDRFHTDFELSSTSASAWSSPEKINRRKNESPVDLEVEENSQNTPDTVLKGRNNNERETTKTNMEIQQLVDNIQNLRSNLQAIHEKTLTPVNSPRRNKNIEKRRTAVYSTSDEDEVKLSKDGSPTPKAKGVCSTSHYGVEFNTTPPVKDTGMKMPEDMDSLRGDMMRLPGGLTTASVQNRTKVGSRNDTSPPTSSADRLHQMRTVLKDLEDARKKYDNSKLPRRNLNFDSTSEHLQTDKPMEGNGSYKQPTSLTMSEDTQDAASNINIMSNQTAWTKRDVHTQPNDRFKPPNNGSDQNVPKSNSTDTKSLLDREFEEMNTFLDQVKNSSLTAKYSPLDAGRLSLLEKTSATRFDSGSIATTTGKLSKDGQETTDFLKKALEDETHSRQELEKTVSVLKKQLLDQRDQISLLEKANNEKLQLLLEVKLRWSEVSQQWIKDQQELAHKLKESHEENTQLKDENKGAKEQFSICQEELQKALQIATDFKMKLEEEEKIKNDVLNELLSQKTIKVKQLQVEQVKLEEMTNENHALKLHIEQIQNENQLLVTTQADTEAQASNDLSKAEENIEKLKLENQELIQKEHDVKHEKEAIESSLHTFYASQMESILTEKISILQSNVKAWETNMAREKQEAMDFLQNQHVIQMESLSERHYKDLDKSKNEMKVLKASLSATRKEADALREQLGLERKRSETKKSKASSTLARPDISSNPLPTASSNNIDMMALGERNGVAQEQHFRSLSLFYNNHVIPRSIDAYNGQEEDVLATQRQQKLWAELLNSASPTLGHTPFSMVQNNLFGSPNLPQPTRSVQMMNENVIDDDLTSSSSGENRHKQEDASRRSLPAELVPGRNKYRARSLRHNYRTRSSAAEPHPISNTRVGANTNLHPLSNLATEMNNSSTDDRKSESVRLQQRNAISLGSRSQTVNAVSSSILQKLLQKNSLYSQLTTDRTEDEEQMTTGEKKEVVKNFVKGFFDDYPEAVLDPQLVSDLNEMALRLVDPSPTHYGNGEISPSSSLYEGNTSLSKTSTYELKKMLAEKLSNSVVSQPVQLGAAIVRSQEQLSERNTSAQKDIEALPKKYSSTKSENLKKGRTRTTKKDQHEKDRYSSDS